MSDLTNDQLADEITTWAGRVAAGEARLLELIGELDAREAWTVAGVKSCAHWLSWRLGLGANAARERVRVAARLRTLPLIAAAFQQGRLSFSQVRAITRISDVLVEADWILYARSLTGAQLEKLVRAVNRATRPEREAADPDRAAWLARPRVRHTEDGLTQIIFTVPTDASPVVLAGLERITTDLQAQQAESVTAVTPPAAQQPLPTPAEPTVRDWAALTATERAALDAWRTACQQVAAHNAAHNAAQTAARTAALSRPTQPARPVTWNDALIQLATSALDAPGLLPVAAKERLRVNVDPVSGWARLRDGELLPPGCTSTPTGTFVPVDLTAFDLGRTSRLVTLPLRRFLGDLDGERCRFPSCTATKNLHAHHVRFWSTGGRTDLANLVLVCARHHTLIHTQGFQLVLTPDRQLTVRTANDIPVPHHPTLPTGDAAQLPDVSAETLPPQLDPDPIDWDWAVYVIANQAA